MRKLVSALAISAGLVLLAIPASAQDYPSDSHKLTVSESTVSPGDQIVVAGEGAGPGATVTIALSRSSSALGSGARVVAAGPALARTVAAVRPLAQGSITLGSTTADSDGNFRTMVTIPSGLAPGVYTLIASSGGEVLSSATIRVTAGGSGLLLTGSDVGPGLAVGIGLIIAGGLMLLALRRHRSRSTV